MHLSSLSPFGPIFAMELRTASRRKRNYLLRVGYLGCLLLFLLFAYGISREWGVSGVAARARQQESLGWSFFICFSLFSVIAMALIGPVLTSTAISGERLHKTFHVLLMTPINTWQIAAGKLFSRILTALVLLGLSLPVLALVRLLGGVEISDMFGVILLAAVTLMATAALGLFFSTLMSRTFSVILCSYGTLAFFYLFLPFVAQIIIVIFARNGPSTAWMFTLVRILTALNPPICTGFIVAGGARMFQIGWYPCIISHLAITAILLLLTGLLLRRIARREGEGATPAAMPAAMPAFPAPPLPAPDPSPLSPQSSIPGTSHRSVGDNPILWREVRRPLITSLKLRWIFALLMVALLVATYILIYKVDALDDRETQCGYACIMDTVLLLIVCVLSGTAISQEKESDTWTTLLAAPVSAGAIVWGKTIGILARLLPWYLLITLHFAIFTIAGVISWQATLITLAVMASFNSIWLATGLYLSLRFAKVTAAVMTNLLLPVLLYGGVSLILATAENLVDRRWSPVDHACWYLPYYYMIYALDSLSPGSNTWEIWMPGLGNRPFEYWLFHVIIVCGLHLLLAAVVLFAVTLRFNRIVGRAPQIIGRARKTVLSNPPSPPGAENS